MNTPREPIPTNVVCQQCGYNLTGVAIGGACPECGAHVAPNFAGLARPTNGYAIASIILGIVSIPGCMCYGILGLICGSLAVIFAYIADKQIATGAFADGSKTITLIGKVCGFVGVTLSVLLLGFYIVIIVIAMLN